VNAGLIKQRVAGDNAAGKCGQSGSTGASLGHALEYDAQRCPGYAWRSGLKKNKKKTKKRMPLTKAINEPKNEALSYPTT
jgi:hypothetical protein